MKRLLLINTLIIITLLSFLDNSFAGRKEKTTIKLLYNGEWQAIMVGNTDLSPLSKVTLNFDKTQLTYYLEYKTKSGKEKYTEKSNYYLSETPDSIIEKRKIGKIKNGKYIIVKKSEIYEIITLTSTYLKIRMLDGATHEYVRKEEDVNNISKKFS